jgi:hypothetical protein
MSANFCNHSAKHFSEIDISVLTGASYRIQILYFICLRIVEKSPTEELNPLTIRHTAKVISKAITGIDNNALQTEI